MSDPPLQALTLTAIVITFAVSAFLLALIYRSWRTGQADTVHDDEVDIAVRTRTEVDEEQMDDEDIHRRRRRRRHDRLHRNGHCPHHRAAPPRPRRHPRRCAHRPTERPARGGARRRRRRRWRREKR